VTTALTVLNDTAISPRWNEIRKAAAWAWQWYLDGIQAERPHRQLLTPPGANTKLAKGNVPIYGLTLAPAGMSGYQLCPWRSPECETACLGKTAGRSRFSNVQEARIRKTRILMEKPVEFFWQLYEELAKAEYKHGSNFAFRSNVLSDIPWETIAPEIYQFTPHNYDYTKSFKRAMDSRREGFPVHLTLSYSGHNYDDCVQYLNAGGNVAVVFAKDLPDRCMGTRVISGDENDARFLDPKGGYVIGLKAKGNIDTTSPFVVSC
jgi:hypothetical protein